MKALFESFHRPLIVGLGSGIVFVSVLILGSIFAAPPPAKAAGAMTDRRTVATAPSCTRRVTVNSKPCGAMIYIDGIQVGRTPMSFPMPMGGYTLVLLAPGHQQYAQRILVPDAPPLEINANLIPRK